MFWRVLGLLVTAAVGLSVALASQSATAALVVSDALPFLGGQDDNLVESLASEVLASAEMAGQSSLPGAGPASSQDEEDNRPTVRHFEGLLATPAAASQAGSVSQPGGAGSTSAALAVAPIYLPQTGPRTTLPTEAKTIFPTGPPFELLRPPRAGLAG